MSHYKTPSGTPRYKPRGGIQSARESNYWRELAARGIVEPEEYTTTVYEALQVAGIPLQDSFLERFKL